MCLRILADVQIGLISLMNGNVTERQCLYQRAGSESLITHYSHSKFLFS